MKILRRSLVLRTKQYVFKFNFLISFSMFEIASLAKKKGTASITSKPLKEMVSMANELGTDGLRAWEDTNWKQWRGDYSDMSPW